MSFVLISSRTSDKAPLGLVVEVDWGLLPARQIVKKLGHKARGKLTAAKRPKLPLGFSQQTSNSNLKIRFVVIGACTIKLFTAVIYRSS
jgi:hypothetical protein